MDAPTASGGVGTPRGPQLRSRQRQPSATARQPVTSRKTSRRCEPYLLANLTSLQTTTAE